MSSRAEGNMSEGEGTGVVLTPLCQGFLKKRKDKMKLRWVTYWFKLHNTTLFFYTKKNGSTSDLRGQYYLFEVESVHEGRRTENKRYVFELTMKNGKRKVLAADTADLRQEWICQLLKAMNHPTTNRSELNSDWMVDSKLRACSSPCSSRSSNSDHNVWRPFSTMSNYQLISSTDPQPVTQYTTAYNPTANVHDLTSDRADTESRYPVHEAKQKIEETECERDYDVLPACKSLSYEENIYDTPPSNRRASERNHEMTESIYDVPTSIFRRNDGEERPESGVLLVDMMDCLGEDSADWVRAAAPRAICKPPQ
ncbi:uncharacterized protein [Hoplias malabaricus]|uniref:uncharacterized protein n=1 Tax=Hoplias malabaricus TaxID=27720 RepID=UPI003463249C